MKKMTIGCWITSIAAILTIVALIVYNVNVSGEGYFHGDVVTNVSLFSVISAVLLIAAVVISMLNSSKIVAVIAGIMQIAAPVLVASSLIRLIGDRAEGLGFIYFSNADVALEVQTAANMSSASMAIISMVVFGVALVLGLIAAFFSLSKKTA